MDDNAWIQLQSGAAFWPLSPRKTDVRIEDIARSLAYTCRFRGHTRDYYSVAQHSVLASYRVGRPAMLHALLHDAAEAYLCDMPRPIKDCILLVPPEKRGNGAIEFRDVERSILRAVYAHIGLDWPASGVQAEVGWSDDVMLATEARDLLPPPAAHWALRAPPDPERIAPLGPESAREMFLQRYHELQAEGYHLDAGKPGKEPTEET